jgi:hypothetical protein
MSRINLNEILAIAKFVPNLVGEHVLCFKEIILILWREEYAEKYVTVEHFLTHATEALLFCQKVRMRANIYITDSVILTVLVNLRKSKKL